MPKLRLEDSLLTQIEQNGFVTIRKYADGRGARTWSAANRLREAGKVRFRGVRTPADANFEARAVSMV